MVQIKISGREDTQINMLPVEAIHLSRIIGMETGWTAKLRSSSLI